MMYFRIFLTLLFSSCLVLVLYNLVNEDRDADAHAECCNAVIPDSFTRPAYQSYKTVCGSCHMAYPPMLLPSAVWQEILYAETHFGHEATISPPLRSALLHVLLEEAADVSATRLARKFRPGMKDPRSSRITDTAFMLQEHPKIYRGLLKNTGDTELKNCRSCHHEAEKGIFCARQVILPY